MDMLTLNNFIKNITVTDSSVQVDESNFPATVSAITEDAETSRELYEVTTSIWNESQFTLYFQDQNYSGAEDLFFEGVLANDTNGTTRYVFSEEQKEQLAHLVFMILLSTLLGLMILVTVIGNVFVIAAILLERNLQSVANYLIVSLSVADLLVACLVMPLGAVYVISNNWIMGPELCDMWTSIDVLCCTASILHLVAIAVDRYWAVTNVIYTRTSRRIGGMIVLIWVVALVVSLAPQIPQFGWKDPDYLYRINVKKQCMVSQNIGYQIFATSSTFYVPLLVIFILYWKIFQAARKRIRKRRDMKSNRGEKSVNNNRKVVADAKNFFMRKRHFLKVKQCREKRNTAAEVLVTSLVMMEGQSTTTVEMTEEQNDRENIQMKDATAFTIAAPQISSQVANNVTPKSSPATSNNGSASYQHHMTDINKVQVISKKMSSYQASVDKLLPSKKEKKESIEAKRERKAAKTLAIITGAFVICWLPFFVFALVMPLCDDCIHPYVMSFFLWLGYFNSTLNPVLYTVFNPEFRQAFKRILCGVHSRRNRNFRLEKIR